MGTSVVRIVWSVSYLLNWLLGEGLNICKYCFHGIAWVSGGEMGVDGD